jgi:hypothetical protein
MTVDEIARLHHQDFDGALIRNDLAKLAKVRGDDHVLVRPDGSILSKDQLLADLKAHAKAFRSIESTNENIHVYGQVRI